MILGVKLLKCTEGQYNKAFLMSMDRGVEVLAKVPNPNAGPAFYTTASEVATRHFVRDSSCWFWWASSDGYGLATYGLELTRPAHSRIFFRFRQSGGCRVHHRGENQRQTVREPLASLGYRIATGSCSSACWLRDKASISFISKARLHLLQEGSGKKRSSCL